MEESLTYLTKILAISLIIISFCYRDITESTISMLECLNFGDETFDEFRLKTNYSINCKETEYKM